MSTFDHQAVRSAISQRLIECRAEIRDLEQMQRDQNTLCRMERHCATLAANQTHILTIAQGVADNCGLTLPIIRGRCRDERTKTARHLTAFFAIEAGHSTKAIGCALGRDHSTITYARQAIQEQLDINNPAIRAMVQSLRAKLAPALHHPNATCAS